MKPHILHLVDLSLVGGIQASFVNTIAHPRFAERYRASVQNVGAGPVLDSWAGRVGACGGTLLDGNRRVAQQGRRGGAGRFRPLADRVRRGLQTVLTVARLRPHVVLLWSIRPRPGFVRIARALGARVVVWDRGVSWLRSPSPSVTRGFAMADAILCNSHAARRMLQLRWKVESRIDICLNAVRPDALAHDVTPRDLPDGQPIRLGFVGRLIPLKGAGIAVAAVARLASDLNVELHIAGTGSEEQFLRALAQRLGVDSRVVFHGLVSDVAAFYRDIDLFVCPSLREPFGLVSVEAQGNGVPALVSGVDGLPETISAGRTGMAIEPRMPLSRYAEFTANVADVPPLVYFPRRDEVGSPLALDPQDLASAIRAVAADPAAYRAMSAAAINHARTAFGFDHHVACATAVLDRVLATRPGITHNPSHV
ncbi:MAG: glycosyltransferase [Spirochaetaceae bacterium]|nr:MAG: glycosyltransferase [Spirochaetaceae bacterium]